MRWLWQILSLSAHCDFSYHSKSILSHTLNHALRLGSSMLTEERLSIRINARWKVCFKLLPFILNLLDLWLKLLFFYWVLTNIFSVWNIEFCFDLLVVVSLCWKIHMSMVKTLCVSWIFKLLWKIKKLLLITLIS